jgi:hypothetical protein
MPDETSDDFSQFKKIDRPLSGALCECGHDYVEHRLPGRECRHADDTAGAVWHCRCAIFIRETPDE